MEFDYFYGRSTEVFAFYQIPKLLITDDRFAEISTDAKLLYSMMLDRTSLSAKSGWVDEEGRVFIYYTQEQVMRDLNCANQKATKLMKELESIAGLISRRRQGQGKPIRIYVKNFASVLEGMPGTGSRPQDHEKHGSDNSPVRQAIPESKDPWKSHGIKTESTKTDISETDPIDPSAIEPGQRAEEIRADRNDVIDSMENTELDNDRTRVNRESVVIQEPDNLAGSTYRMQLVRAAPSLSDPAMERLAVDDYLQEHLDLDLLRERHPLDIDRIDEIAGLMADVLTSHRKTIRVAGEERLTDIVKSRFMKVGYDHVEYILDCFRHLTTQIRNIRQYVLTAIYNAPMTIDHYYTAQVSYDLASA